MKSCKMITALLLALVLLTGCGGGDTSAHGRQIRPSVRYSEQTIADAMDVVESHFKQHFDGCQLLTIVYDEEATGEKASREAERNGKDTIILLTDFTVDDSGAASGLTPGMTYRNYEWTLVKTLFGWELKDWGYA
ncbi:MAG: hypothetical protein IJ960_05215 [Oscillospiraceae bacterium]|nr:hypothetical protein [Oscillospiraceae bacterium]